MGVFLFLFLIVSLSLPSSVIKFHVMGMQIDRKPFSRRSTRYDFYFLERASTCPLPFLTTKVCDPLQMHSVVSGW
ncbi:hypothetical protein F5H01DRAFT_352657 [Linnemannia elongata]|nr:hypothetical protein F5H01DRAFT_352657 [Linnemannia elongata]